MFAAKYCSIFFVSSPCVRMCAHFAPVPVLPLWGVDFEVIVVVKSVAVLLRLQDPLQNTRQRDRAHTPSEIHNSVCDVGATTCISSKVSSSLHRLFFFSSRLSPLSRASRAVASPGAPSRFEASSASNEAALAIRKKYKMIIMIIFDLCIHADLLSTIGTQLCIKTGQNNLQDTGSAHTPFTVLKCLRYTWNQHYIKDTLDDIFLKFEFYFFKASSILQQATQVDILVSFRKVQPPTPRFSES